MEIYLLSFIPYDSKIYARTIKQISSNTINNKFLNINYELWTNDEKNARISYSNSQWMIGNLLSLVKYIS